MRVDDPGDGTLRRQVECDFEFGMHGPVQRELCRRRDRVLHFALRNVGQDFLGVGVRALDPCEVGMAQPQVLERALVCTAGRNLDLAAGRVA